MRPQAGRTHNQPVVTDQSALNPNEQDERRIKMSTTKIYKRMFQNPSKKTFVKVIGGLALGTMIFAATAGAFMLSSGSEAERTTYSIGEVHPDFRVPGYVEWADRVLLGITRED